LPRVKTRSGDTHHERRPATHQESKGAKPTAGQQREPAPKTAGCPKGPPSTIINLRIPLDLLDQLDRYLDHLEVHTGLKANRGMIARRALELFLETRATGKNEP